MATAWRSRSMYSTSSGGPNVFSSLALIRSGQVIVSRPSRIATTNASLTRSLIDAPVAYGVMTASLSTCSSVISCLTLSR